MYEANPMSLIVEQAGGVSTNGHSRFSTFSRNNCINAWRFPRFETGSRAGHSITRHKPQRAQPAGRPASPFSLILTNGRLGYFPDCPCRQVSEWPKQANLPPRVFRTALTELETLISNMETASSAGNVACATSAR